MIDLFLYLSFLVFLSDLAQDTNGTAEQVNYICVQLICLREALQSVFSSEFNICGDFFALLLFFSPLSQMECSVLKLFSFFLSFSLSILFVHLGSIHVKEEVEIC